MKNIILSDLHSGNPFDVLERESFDRAVFLGDYDNPLLLEQILEIDNNIILTGNHDHAFSTGLKISSPRMLGSYEEYYRAWHTHDKARDFVLESIHIKRGRKKGLSVVETSESGKHVFVHAGIKANPVYGLYIPELWDRLIDEEACFSKSAVSYIFRLMQQRRYDVVFRGHDHFSGVFSLKKYKPASQFSIEDEREGVLKGKRYIVNIGEFRRGEYVLFDDETGEFEFKNCGRQDLMYLK